MPTIVEDIDTASKWISKALKSSGYKADFSPESLWEIDRFFDEQSQDGKAKPLGLLSKDLGSRIFSIGAYTGEVIRMHMDGKWVGDDNDPEVEINVELHIGDSIIWPIQRVSKRFKNGPEDGIAVYALALGLPVGPRPEKPSKPWWKIW